METPRKHVLFVSFPEISHITALLCLAKKVARYHTVTFIASASRVAALRERGIFTIEDAKQISLLGLNDGIVPDDHDVKHFGGKNPVASKYSKALEALLSSVPVAGEPRMSKQEQPPGHSGGRSSRRLRHRFCASFSAWPIINRGVPTVIFVASPGIVLSNKINVNQDTPVLADHQFSSDWEARPDVSRTGVPSRFKENCIKFFHGPGALAHRIHAVVLNSIFELEPDCTKMLRTHPGFATKPIRFVAPLFDLSTKTSDPKSGPVLEWLDQQGERGVVYASFGSIAVSNKDQIQEIAKSLLSLKKPFIWGLRKEEHQFLPEEMQTPSKQFLVLLWAPQRDILNHEAIVIFLSHAGWNSYLESMEYGVPMVAWPMFGDHFGIADILVKAGAGVKIPGTSMNFENLIPAQVISNAILNVGGWKDDHKPNGDYKKSAREVGLTIKKATQPGGSSHEAFLEFVKDDIGKSSVKANVVA